MIFDNLKTESSGGVEGHADDSKREAPTSHATHDQLGLAIGVERRAATRRPDLELALAGIKPCPLDSVFH